MSKLDYLFLYTLYIISSVSWSHTYIQFPLVVVQSLLGPLLMQGLKIIEEKVHATFTL
jgi:hypothetical protein